MNIGLVSDLAETGFGRVGRELARRWLDAGHDVRILGINFRGRVGAAADAVIAEKSPQEVAEAIRAVDDDPVLSRALPADTGGDGMGFNLTAPFVRGQLTDGWRPERLFVIADPQAAIQRFMTDEGVSGLVPTFNYVPIEGSGLSPFWRRLWERVEPIAMSEFGAREIGACMGRSDVPVVPHGIGPMFYRITSKHPAKARNVGVLRSKRDAKKALGWTDRTVILRTDRNVPRKDYPAFFAAIRPVIADHPEVLVVIHCSPVDEGGAIAEWLADLPGAYDLGGGWKHSQVLLTKAHDTFRGVTDNQLNVMYNAADIYASPSWAEGFGLTLAEAARCGTPVVTTDFAAGPEAIGPGGICVPTARLMASMHGHHWGIVDVGKFSAALECLVTQPKLRDELGLLGERHSARFDWDRAAIQTLQIMGA
jgi:glycosyltransferase involved in cell wall biosynthesis